MVCVRVIMLISCLVSCVGVASAEVQVESEGQPTIGLQQTNLAMSVAALLDNNIPSETLLSRQDSTAWIEEGELPQYQIINRRAIRIRSCCIYFYQTSETFPDDSFWRERFSHYGIPIVKIPGEDRNADLFSLASELGRLFPEQRETISENLCRELERRRSVYAQNQLAIHRFE